MKKILEILSKKSFFLDPVSVITTPSPLPTEVCTGLTNTVTYELTNNSGSPIVISSIQANFSDRKLFTFDDQCSNLALGAGKICTYTVNFQSDTPQDSISAKPQLSYAGNTVPLPEWNFLANDCVQITGNVEKALPNQIGVNNPTDVIFKFTNISIVVATQVAVTFDSNPELSNIKDNCKNNEKTLAPGASCEVSATLTPSSAGNKTVSVTLSYAEGKPVPLSTSSEALPAQVVGVIDKELPDKMGINDNAMVSFKFTNSTIATATQVAVDFDQNSDLSNINDQCINSTKTLAAGASCEVSATLTPSSTGDKTVTINFSYAEEENPISLSSSTLVELVNVTGNIDAKGNLPTYTSSGRSYPVKFLFNNTSELPATKIIINGSTNLSNINGTCTTNSQIDPNTSCEVTATFTPTVAPGIEETATVTLSYLESKNPVTASTSTTVDNTLLVSVGENSTILRSMDGNYWQKITPPENLAADTILMGVAANDSNKQMVITGTKGSILTSDNAKDWSIQQSNTSEEFPGVTWSHDLDLFIAVGSNASIITSENGENWTLQADSSNQPNELIDVICPIGQPCVAIGQMGTILNSSDGKNWEQSQTGSKAMLTGFIWSDEDEQFFVVGQDSSSILSSFNGKNWSKTTLPSGSQLVDITYSQLLKLYIAVGSAGSVMSSPDGYIWTAETSPTSNDLNKVIWDESVHLFITAGDKGELFISDNGEIWSPIIDKSVLTNLKGIGKLKVTTTV